MQFEGREWPSGSMTMQCNSPLLYRESIGTVLAAFCPGLVASLHSGRVKIDTAAWEQRERNKMNMYMKKRRDAL